MSDEKVVSLQQYRRADVIGALEEMLETARAGHVLSIAAVLLTADDVVEVHYTPEGHWLKLAGATAQLHHAVMANPEEWT